MTQVSTTQIGMHRFFSILVLFLIVGCHFIGSDPNVDPNQPIDIPMSQLLPNAQTTLAYLQGGILSRYVTLWMQQTTSLAGQSVPPDQYRVLDADMDRLWTNFYAGILMDLREIRRQAEDPVAFSPHYTGIAKVLEVITVTQLVDLWSDIPYSEALRGTENLKPAYDQGAEVYESLHLLLEEALSDLNAPASDFHPGVDDLIYGGDLAAWSGLARLCKARLYLHRSQYGRVLETLSQGGLGSNEQNAFVCFGEGEQEQSPWFQFSFQRGDIGMCSVLVDLMTNLGDPRLPVFATLDAGGGYSGNPPGKGYDPGISKVGSFYASSASPVPLALYPEQLFIEAEAALTLDPARAALAYNEGVAASLAMFGVEDPGYLAAYASESAGTITLEKIATQKYIALFTMPELFSDWRRTGIPALTPVEGFDQIARRFSYPPVEQALNGDNCPDGITIFDRVFWDQ